MGFVVVVFVLVHSEFVSYNDFGKTDGYSEGSRTKGRKGM